MEDRNYAAL